MIRKNEITITKLLQGIFSVTLVFVLLAVGIAYYEYSAKLISENVERSLRDFSIAAQYIIDGDKHVSITDSSSETYKELCDILTKYKKDVGVYDVYTIVRGDDTHTKLFLATYDAESSFMEDYIYTDEMRRAFDGNVVITKKPYTDNYGTFYSGYAPLYDSNENIVALVAVDMKADSVELLKKDLINKTIMIFITCFVVGNIFLYMFSKELGKGFNSITLRLKKIGKGDLTVANESNLLMVREIKEIEKTIIEMQNDINELVTIVKDSSSDLKERTGHFLDVIVSTETSSQFMETTVDEMVSIYGEVSELFNQAMEKLVHYKVSNDENFIMFKGILDSIENSKDLLERILFKMREGDDIKASKEELTSLINMLYIEYDAFSEALPKQADFIENVEAKRNELIDINKQTSDKMGMVNGGNKLVAGAMKKQVDVIRDAVKDVEYLRELAEELDVKIQNLKTH